MAPSKCEDQEARIGLTRHPIVVNHGELACASAGYPNPVHQLENELGVSAASVDALKRERLRLQHLDKNATVSAGVYTTEGYFAFAVPKTQVIQAMEKEEAVLAARVAKLSKASKTVQDVAHRALQPGKAK